MHDNMHLQLRNRIAKKLTIGAVPPVWLVLYFLSQLLGILVVIGFEQAGVEGFLSRELLLDCNLLRQVYIYRRAYMQEMRASRRVHNQEVRAAHQARASHSRLPCQPQDALNDLSVLVAR